MVMSSGVTFGAQVCGDLAEGAMREWLVPDGLGGYAMGTVSGLRTRRYHGLLVVAGSHPGERSVGLISLDPVLRLRSGAVVRLGTHEWTSGSVQPAGHLCLSRFEMRDGLPLWRWRVGEVVLERELAMIHGRSSLGVIYRLRSGEPVSLSVEALCTWRDAHGDRHDVGTPLGMQATADGVVIENAYRLAGPGWTPSGLWYEGAHLREEAARGLGSDEDVWLAGSFNAELALGESIEVSAWSGDLSSAPPPASVVVSAAHQRASQITTSASDEVDATLALAADAFVIQRSGRPDVVAGYPWFGAWSRDTMTSYEGLFLSTGRYDEGRDLLRGYASTLSGGMLANTADTGALEYNTVDATLWFLHAIGRHVDVTGDIDLAATLLGDMTSIITAHISGVRHGVRVDPADGLMTGGAPGLALTWMDARVNNSVITPRVGKPVEVNALWVNGLATVAALGAKLDQDVAAIASAHDRARTSFQKRFPNGAAGLFDVVDGLAGDDPAVRPNQLLAYSLPHAPMDGPPSSQLSRLVTPLGLRTLDPDDPAYRGRHRGDQVDRDEAYHQGTVWPWLIGPYVDACRRDPGVDVSLLLDGLVAHLGDYGLGSVSETADGDAPHGATGCPFQAWSVAEVLRVRRSLLSAA
jgi:predicted glycogen debranching enzyme